MSDRTIPPPRSKRPSLADELDNALGEPDSSLVPTVFLVGLTGAHAGKLFKVPPGESTIGRSSRSFVCFDQKAVSHKHVLLRLTPLGCTILDLDSTNGTFLNDRKLTEAQELNAGDVIRVGNNALGFLTDSEDEQQHTRAMARLTSPRLLKQPGTQTFGLAETEQPFSDGKALVVADNPVGLGSAQNSQHPSAIIEEEPSALDGALDKLEQLFGFIRRYWILLVVGTVVGALGGAGFGMTRPPMAFADFEIYLRQEATPDPSRPSGQDFGIQGGEFFAFAEKKFTDPNLVSRTLEALNVPVNRHIAGATAARLKISAVDRQGTFRGSYMDLDRAFAERFLAAHLQTFLEAEINKALKVQASEVSLMRQEFEQNEEELNRVEKDLQEFKEEHLLALPDNARAELSTRGNLLAQKDRLISEISRYSAELELKKKQIDSGDSLVVTQVNRAKPYEDSLSQVRKNIAEATARGYTDAHPELVRLREEETRLQSLIAETLSQDATDTDRKASANYQRLKDRASELSVLLGSSRQELGQVEARLGQLASISGKMPEVEADITRLMRTAAAKKDIHERLHVELKRKELELKFERASVAARYEVMQPPRASQPPRIMAVAKFAGAGTAGGLGLSVFAALFHWVLQYARQRRIRVSSPTQTLARTQD